MPACPRPASGEGGGCGQGGRRHPPGRMSVLIVLRSMILLLLRHALRWLPCMMGVLRRLGRVGELALGEPVSRLVGCELGRDRGRSWTPNLRNGRTHAFGSWWAPEFGDPPPPADLLLQVVVRAEAGGAGIVAQR